MSGIQHEIKIAVDAVEAAYAQLQNPLRKPQRKPQAKRVAKRGSRAV